MKKPLLLLLLFSFVVACEKTPTGRRQLTLLPDSQLAQMGTQAFADLKRSQTLATDPRIIEPVRCVAQALVDTLPADRRQTWEIAVFRDPSPNAFALPGGKIGVHTGLLQVTENVSQLAAVIGHEIAHVLADHGNERLTQELGIKAVLFLIGFLGEGDWEQQVLLDALGLGAQLGITLPFSRTHEREADIIGLHLMAQAGFDPRESLNLWRNMARAGGDQPMEFLSTHPSHDTRFETLEEAMDQALNMRQTALNQGSRPDCSLQSQLG